ncbi:MAG TPA: response regulator [Vicinamibacterales bacterium]|nr:response regulator [Vicinamibacterales bacterium]
MSKVLRILHLEDDAADRELVARTLAGDGLECDITPVESREQFERALEGAPHDVILADESLPSFDGQAALAMASERCPDVPFIFVSGTLGEETAVERLKAGARDYVLKQRLSRLPSSVRRALAEGRALAERRRAEEELHRLNLELERRVAERTASLEAANRELRIAQERLRAAKEEADAASRAKSEFLSRMSHDLRTPLNSILGFAQLLELEPLTPEQADNVRKILKGGAHLLALINEVLDLTRIEAGHLTLSPEATSVPEVVESAAALMQPMARSHGIELRNLVRADPPRYVRADRQRLSQILLNLISNAIKYNREHGRVTIDCVDHDGRTRIRVIDSGPGIAPENVRLLFTPFERLGAAQTGIEGTGLGLLLSRRLAEAMGGSIGVETEVDRGSTFWVELPVSQAASRNLPPLAASPDPGASLVTGTVLYIEDNLANVELMTRIFARRPHVRLLSAPDGPRGLRIARGERVDLVLLDLHLPGMHGDDVLRRLRADPATREIPVVILTADATEGQSSRLLTAGAVAYLTKPLDIASLLKLIDRTLEARAARGEAESDARR